MSRPARVIDVKPLGQLRLGLTFSDGLVRELGFDRMLEGGLFESLRDPAAFAKVVVDQVGGTVAWPNIGIDFDPDVLHGDHEAATGPSPVVLREYALPGTG